MKRKLTVLFHDEDLYLRLKTEADRRQMALSDVVTDAVREWLENCEDEGLLPIIEAARSEWEEKGGHLWPEVEHNFIRPDVRQRRIQP